MTISTVTTNDTLYMAFVCACTTAMTKEQQHFVCTVQQTAPMRSVNNTHHPLRQERCVNFKLYNVHTHSDIGLGRRPFVSCLHRLMHATNSFIYLFIYAYFHNGLHAVMVSRSSKNVARLKYFFTPIYPLDEITNAPSTRYYNTPWD